ncbi:MAG: heme lyase CcmF/NrfE family subunit [Anaerolineae bacterium]|nr:heme lyase CcmF/NrfE family subunit [Anaerolineae bacterium]MCO5190513.1 heme lyase CcmF/NrfE family subunit [Anaerolineae bacterium]MCO5198784.1 heme lyase CcmF/NrfE family subunit [Anaerolineae bacterium]MCO5207896.1 heme lyase CcmF/NrfE family subunit [Anaerolineae bacterium]
MLADIGYASLVTALIASVFAAFASWYGARTGNHRWVESARNAIAITFPLILVACLTMIVSLVRNDFSLEYVASVTSLDMPTYLKVTALWGGQKGSLLFWNLLLSLFTAAAMQRKWREDRELMPYALLVASFTQIFFLIITIFFENPFTRLPVVPLDGRGLNPLLRHPGMIIHPPMLYLGFVGFTIPYVFAMAALMSGHLDDAWIRTTRRWTLVAWLFLSLGLILGGRWAYDVLGWGGYWGWDPVENASLMPWLAGTAFLHSVMIQEKRGMFKLWNMVLIVITFLLVISGTFIVRSGVISSVHSFAQSAIGPLFFGFLVIMLVFSVYWIIRRHDALSAENRLNSFLSRESAFLANNFLIIAILAAVFIGTYFPIMSEMFGDKVVVGPPYYEKVTGPLFALLVLLMGIAPLTMWFRTNGMKMLRAMAWPAVGALIPIVIMIVVGLGSPGTWLGLWIATFAGILTVREYLKGTWARMRSKHENPFRALYSLVARNRRRYGGYLIHLGVVAMAFGIIGIEFFQQETQLLMQTGQTVDLGRYTLLFNGVDRFAGRDDLIITEATMDVYIGDRLVKTINPRTELYTRTGQPMTIPDLRSTPLEDFYVLLVAWEPQLADQATVRIYLNPLVNWVWAGGIIFIFGTLIAAWPDRADEKAIAASRARQRVAVATD